MSSRENGDGEAKESKVSNTTHAYIGNGNAHMWFRGEGREPRPIERGRGAPRCRRGARSSRHVSRSGTLRDSGAWLPGRIVTCVLFDFRCWTGDLPEAHAAYHRHRGYRVTYS